MTPANGPGLVALQVHCVAADIEGRGGGGRAGPLHRRDKATLGDRCGTLKDRWGNHWNIAKRIRNMTREEMKKSGEESACKPGR